MVAKRQEDGSVAFESIREALPNPYWTTKFLLWWLPGDYLKRFAKANSKILELYGGKKTPINKLPKSKVVELLVAHTNPIRIENVVLRYLRSDELYNRRREAKQINNARKNYDARMLERERQYRIDNWPYLKEDLRHILNDRESSRCIRLYSLGRNYLPLSIEYNAKGVHNGYFVYNNDTKTVDFHLKQNNDWDCVVCVPSVLNDEAFFKLLHKALLQNMSLSQFDTEIKEYINK